MSRWKKNRKTSSDKHRNATILTQSKFNIEKSFTEEDRSPSKDQHSEGSQKLREWSLMQKSILSYFTDDHLHNCYRYYWIIYSKTKDIMNTKKFNEKSEVYIKYLGWVITYSFGMNSYKEKGTSLTNAGDGHVLTHTKIVHLLHLEHPKKCCMIYLAP